MISFVSRVSCRRESSMWRSTWRTNGESGWLRTSRVSAWSLSASGVSGVFSSWLATERKVSRTAIASRRAAAWRRCSSMFVPIENQRTIFPAVSWSGRIRTRNQWSSPSRPRSRSSRSNGSPAASARPQAAITSSRVSGSWSRIQPSPISASGGSPVNAVKLRL